MFKSSPHAKQMKNSVVMTPPPIHINGQGNREVSTLKFQSMHVSVEAFQQSGPNIALRAVSSDLEHMCRIHRSLHGIYMTVL